MAMMGSGDSIGRAREEDVEVVEGIRHIAKGGQWSASKGAGQTRQAHTQDLKLLARCAVSTSRRGRQAALAQPAILILPSEEPTCTNKTGV